MLLAEEIKCCDKCWHSSTKPCHDFIECLNSGPSCHSDEQCKELLSNQFKDEDVKIPTIYIGVSSCSLAKGVLKTNIAISRYLSQNKIPAEIIETGCNGYCSEEPFVSVKLEGKSLITFKKVTESNAAEIIENILDGKVLGEHVFGQNRNNEYESWENVPYIDDLPFFKNQTKILTENFGINKPADIKDYIKRGGFQALSKILKSKTQSEVCGIIEESGLRDRGSKSYYSGKKWKQLLTGGKKDLVLVCNADSPDTANSLDRLLIENDPFRIIEGIIIAGYAMGINKGRLFINAESMLAIERFRNALSEAEELGLVGSNILDSGFDFDLSIKRNPGAVCTEDIAIANSIYGRRPISQVQPNQNGNINKQLIKEQAETLANLPKIILNGAKWFKSFGTEESSGTKAFAIYGHSNNTGLAEIEFGCDLSYLVENIGGGIRDGRNLKAVQIGGPFGGCIKAEEMDTKISYEALLNKNIGFASGSIGFLNEDTCMVDLLFYYLDFIHKGSCGSCIPCREGTKRMYDIISRMITKEKPGDEISQLDRFHSFLHLDNLTEAVKSSGACTYGVNSANPVVNIMNLFRDEFETHVYEKKCPAKTCKDLVTYKILESKCTGCADCVMYCPSAAIHGTKDNVHFISEDKCISCGICVEVCTYEAIETE